MKLDSEFLHEFEKHSRIVHTFMNMERDRIVEAFILCYRLDKISCGWRKRDYKVYDPIVSGRIHYYDGWSFPYFPEDEDDAKGIKGHILIEGSRHWNGDEEEYSYPVSYEDLFDRYDEWKAKMLAKIEQKKIDVVIEKKRKEGEQEDNDKEARRQKWEELNKEFGND